MFLIPGVKRGAAPHGASFYDEDGKWHFHDTRLIVSRYECSNGHRFRREQLESCPSCEFGHEPAKVFVGKLGVERPA